MFTKPVTLLAALALAVLTLFSTPMSHAATKAPNIVVFIADDHGWWDSSVHGATDVRTPAMMRLARAGMTLNHAFVASPSCAPSRAAMLTGLMPARNGAEANHARPRDEVKKLPSYFHELGYEVAAFGKVAHYGQADLYGFDITGAGEYADTNNVPSALRYLEQRSTKDAKPLCLFVGTHEPHVPWPDVDGYDPAKVVIPPKHVDTPETREMRAKYYTAVTLFDSLLGQVIDLAFSKLGRETLFVFTSDHGAQWPFGKWNLYDTGTRVPMIVVWQEHIKAASQSDAMVSWVDLLPTLLELAGGDTPNGIDGRSFANVLLGKADAHREMIFTTHDNDEEMNVYPIRSIRTREWKYILNLHPDWAHTTHIDKAEGRDGLVYWKSWLKQAETNNGAALAVKRYHERPAEELYYLPGDPYEQFNLADNPVHAERLAKFRLQVTAWMANQGDDGEVEPKPRLLVDPASRMPPTE